MSRRAFLGAVAGMGGLLAGCTSGGPVARSAAPGATGSTTSPLVPPAPSTTPGRSALQVDPRTFGAAGDGHTDDSDALQRALQAVPPGGALVLASGRVFTHRRVLTVDTPHVSIIGPGRLLATQEESSALQIGADHVTVDAVSLGVAGTTKRWSAPDQHKLYVGPHDGVVVRDVVIDGSAAAGLFSAGASNFTFERVRVSGTRADGIHMTQGSHHGTVLAPHIADTGDDGVAVVSYLEDGTACHDIVVQSPVVESTSGGRGISVVGGSRVQYRDVDIRDSFAAGVYIACESGDFTTFSVDDVQVVSGRVDGANSNSYIDHGSVLVYSGRSGGSVTDVQISGLRIAGTRSTASRQIGVVVDNSSCHISGIVFRDLQLAPSPTPYEGNGPLDAITTVNVRARGADVKATLP